MLVLLLNSNDHGSLLEQVDQELIHSLFGQLGSFVFVLVALCCLNSSWRWFIDFLKVRMVDGYVLVECLLIYCKDGLVFVCPLYWKFRVNNDGLVLCWNAIYSSYAHYINHYIVSHT